MQLKWISRTFTARSNEILVDTTETTVNSKMALGDPLKTSDQTSILQIPKVNSLMSDVEQCLTICFIYTKGHYSMVFLQSEIIRKFVHRQENEFFPSKDNSAEI